MNRFLDAPELALYRRSLQELLREKPHTLSEPEERLLGTLGDVLGTPSKTFGILNDADLDFGRIRGENGKSRPLTHGSYRRFLESSDREVRKRAFRKMFSTYHKFRNTFASTLDGVVKRHVTGAKIRRYPSALEPGALFRQRPGRGLPEPDYGGPRQARRILRLYEAAARGHEARQTRHVRHVQPARAFLPQGVYPSPKPSIS